MSLPSQSIEKNMSQAHGQIGRLTCLWIPLVLGYVLASGCGEGDVEGDPSGRADGRADGDVAATETRLSEEQLERKEELRALGYVAWDSGADTSRKGVTWLDAERVAPGYNLYTNEATRVYLTDLDGRRLHTWKLSAEKKWCELAELLEDGWIAVVCPTRSLTVLDWDSNIVLDVERKVHHDVAALPDGGFIVPMSRTKKYRGRRVIFDSLARLSAEGELEAEWSTFAVLSDLQRLHPPLPLDIRRARSTNAKEEKLALRASDNRATKWLGFDYYHLNSVEILPNTPLGRRDPRFRAGNLLICLRNVDLILVLDQDDLSVVWHWGAETLDLPHMPTMLASGNILIFDNGKYRGFSRVLEIEPASGRIVWQYQGDPPESFFSQWRGSVQRLANDNTLICESERGYVFEVTAAGKKVWEFWNPELKGDERKRIYRFMRIDPSRVEPLLH